MQKIFFVTAFVCLSILVAAQNKPGAELHIKKAKGEIKLDGVLDEPDWLAADAASNWFTPNSYGDQVCKKDFRFYPSRRVSIFNHGCARTGSEEL